jgi:uncharacterized protein with von Willebrand factor type A (vWA) domain
VLEVEHLIQALKAEGKKFEYEIYENAPAGMASTGWTPRRRANRVRRSIASWRGISRRTIR